MKTKIRTTRQPVIEYRWKPSNKVLRPDEVLITSSGQPVRPVSPLFTNRQVSAVKK